MSHLIEAQIALRSKQIQLAVTMALKAIETGGIPQAQCILARLAWDDLAEASGIAFSTLTHHEVGEGVPAAKSKTLDVI